MPILPRSIGNVAVFNEMVNGVNSGVGFEVELADEILLDDVVSLVGFSSSASGFDVIFVF